MVFVVVILVLVGGGIIAYTLRSSSGGAMVAINARLGRYGLAGVSAGGHVVSLPGSNKKSFSKVMERAVQRGGLTAPIGDRLDRADLKMVPSEFVSIAIVVFLVAALLGLVLKGTLGLLGVGALGAVGP